VVSVTDSYGRILGFLDRIIINYYYYYTFIFLFIYIELLDCSPLDIYHVQSVSHLQFLLVFLLLSNICCSPLPYFAVCV
jgi:hypothetical protein